MTSEQAQEIERWFAELYRLMWAMVWDIGNSDRFYLDPQDVFADLSEELVKVVLRYADKGEDEMKPLLIVSLRNRCRDLLKMEFGTHRHAEMHNVSLDEDPEEGGFVNLEHIGIENPHFDLDGFLIALSDDAYYVVDEVLQPSDRLLMEMQLTIMRKESISRSNGWTLRPTQRMYQRSLGWSEERFEIAWQEVCDLLSSW